MARKRSKLDLMITDRQLVWKRMGQPSEEDAKFIKSDPALHSYYVLQMAGRDEPQCDTIESYCRFLVWFILEGRKRYQHPLVIPQAIRGAMTSLTFEGRHLLMNLALTSTFGAITDDDEALARYYFHSVPQFGLGSFISHAEMNAVKARSPLTHLSRLAEAVEQSGSGAVKPCELLNQYGRLALASTTVDLPSVSIIGFYKSVLGLGEDTRSLFDCLLDAGVTPELIDVSPQSLEPFAGARAYSAFETSRPNGPLETLRPNGSIVIFCMPAFEMMRLVCTLGVTPAQGQYWIGYWPWETTALHASWLRAFEFVDEVWASSIFLREVYSRQTQKRVSHIPLNVHVSAPREPDEIGALLASKFTFLCVFDFHSQIERKNPIGAISAFRAAFPRKTENVQMILKTLHGERRPDEFNAVRAAMDEDERILLVDGALGRAEICWLIQNSQVYLSLHRSEGFGRPIAEAMLLGTPVIGTGWSGNSDFLNEETGFPVRYRLRPVGPTEYPFAAGEWAEPDIEHATDVMRRLYQSGGASHKITLRAKEVVTKLFSRPSISAKLIERLTAIGRAMKSDEQSGVDKLRDVPCAPADQAATKRERIKRSLKL
jgi:glycosyltransferase involved in cell wall biosynthesis